MTCPVCKENPNADCPLCRIDALDMAARATTQEGYKKALTAKHVSQLKTYGLTWDQLKEIRFLVGCVSKEDYDEE